MDRLVDAETREVDGDRLGDRIRGNPHFHGVVHDVERAADLDARARVLIDEVHGNVDAQRRAGLQAQEVNMHGLVGDDIELVVARNRPLDLAADVDIENRRQEVTGVDERVE